MIYFVSVSCFGTTPFPKRSLSPHQSQKTDISRRINADWDEKEAQAAANVGLSFLISD
jgi:hypothetical protein